MAIKYHIFSQLQIRGGIHILFFLFLHENKCRWYSLEATQWGTSNEYHNVCLHEEIRKVSIIFIWKKNMCLIWGYVVCFQTQPKRQSNYKNRIYKLFCYYTWLVSIVTVTNMLFIYTVILPLLLIHKRQLAKVCAKVLVKPLAIKGQAPPQIMMVANSNNLLTNSIWTILLLLQPLEYFKKENKTILNKF